MRVLEFMDAFHNIIKTLRTYPGLSDVRFVRRYGTRPSENPIKGYLAACGISEMKSAPRFLGADSPSDMRLCSCVARIDLYSPFDKKSAETEKKTGLITKGILKADSNSIVKSVEVGDLDFDSELRAVKRKIIVRTEAYVSGEDEL